MALVGVPGDLDRPGGRPLRYLRRHGYAGAIHLVHPRHAEIGGTSTVPRLEAVPGPVDVVWIGLPAAAAAEAVRAAGRVGAGYAVVLGSGFAEAGPDGQAAQAELVRAAREAGVRLVGPNTVGYVNAWDRVALTFSTVGELPALHPGPVALLSQSGGTGGLLLNQAADRRRGVGLFVSTGNEADLDLADYLDGLVEDGRARVVACVVEQARAPARLAGAVERALARGVAVVALKLGGSAAGARTARTHTGSLVGARDAWEAWARAAGILTVASPGELLDVASYLAATPPPGSSRAAMVTSSGGIAVLVADALEPRGIRFPPLAPATTQRLAALLPAYAGLDNPVDVTAGLPDAVFGQVLAAVAEDPEVDLLVVPLTMATAEGGRARATAVAAALAASAKPASVCWPGGSLVEAGRRLLDEAGVPVFHDVEGCAAALGASVRLADLRARSPGRCPATDGLALPPLPPEGGPLDWPTVRALLRSAELPLVPDAVVAGAEEARQAAGRLGYPVALKGLGALHKTDAGQVRLHLADGDQVAAAYEALAPGASGALVQPMARGVEVLVGALRDPALGPFVVVAPGGVHAELFGERVLAPAPLGPAEAAALLAACPALGRLLRGYRGAEPADLAALAAAVAALSRLAAALGDRLGEIDLNPVMAGPAGCRVVDVRVLLEPARPA